MIDPAEHRTLSDRMAAIVGTNGVLVEAADMAPYLADQRGRYAGAGRIVVLPKSTEQVAAVVKLCAAEGLGIVPQGGNTGLVGGGIPFDRDTEVVVGLKRMNRIRGIDPANDTMTVDAGCILAAIQDAAEDSGRLFPLSLSAEGSCQIGGNLSTNAGGIAVLRYGNARDLVLGLEVVLPDGEIWSGLRGLRKDNTGYDLKQIFIGAEGTLGIITGAVLKLFPKPVDRQVALAGVPDVEAATALLGRARQVCGEHLTAFELMSRRCLDFVCRHIPDTKDPMSESYPWYVLVELSAGRGDAGLRGAIEAVLTEGLEGGTVADAVIAETIEQADALWRLRHAINESQKSEGGSIKHDVSVPVSAIPAFVRQVSERVEAACPGIRPVFFGHVGDGNLHLNLSQPPADDREAFLARWQEINDVVYDIAESFDGSFSAEHGIGRSLRGQLASRRPEADVDLMRRLKQALDPRGIMNPGKLI